MYMSDQILHIDILRFYNNNLKNFSVFSVVRDYIHLSHSHLTLTSHIITYSPLITSHTHLS